MKRLLILFFMLIVALQNADAQLLPLFGGTRTGTTGFQFLKNSVDARGSSMGGAFIAEVNDVSALYWNPAGITKVDTQHIHLMASQTSFFAGMNQQFVGAVIKKSAETFFGVSYMGFYSPEMLYTTEFQPYGTGQTFRAYDMAVGVTLARILTDNFSFGITAKYLRESYAEVHTQNGVVDFGFQYEVGKANTRFAAGVSNFGFTAEPKGTVIATTLNGINTLSGFEKMAVPAMFRLGVAWDAVKKKDNRLTFCGQLNHPTDNNETFSLGGEYSWKENLFARTGYELGQDENGLPSFGFGLKFKRRFGIIQMDYGFSNKHTLGNIHRLTFSLSLFN
ncbi:hypothetical protein LBMAG27_08700 [Bacteroidota bacterium]|nr:hypothetical protein LBMAG27_08700 [Bacteroidota bacterium]